MTDAVATKWSSVREDTAVDQTVEALKANGINAVRVASADEAKQAVLELIPEGAQVFQSTSVTLDTIGLSEAINESGRYDAVRPKLMDPNIDPSEKVGLGATPEWVVGSVHAVTEDGKLLIASNTGSQLASESYGAQHVVWVAGTNKIVKDLDEAMERVYEYTLPLEEIRARKAYGIPEDQPGSFISKLLIVNREINPQRATIVLVDEVLGF